MQAIFYCLLTQIKDSRQKERTASCNNWELINILTQKSLTNQVHISLRFRVYDLRFEV